MNTLQTITAATIGIALATSAAAVDFTDTAPVVSSTPNRPNDIRTQPEVNNLPKLAEPQDVSNFTVTIRSTPLGATVYLDRNRVGVTPFTTTLGKDIYGIKIEKEGYQPKIGQIEDGQQDFYVELAPE